MLLCVPALGLDFAGLVALGRLCAFLTTTRDIFGCCTTPALDFTLQCARIAVALVAETCALVLSTAERLTADLIARWAHVGAALATTRMHFAGTKILALGLARERLRAGDFFAEQTTTTLFLDNFSAFGAFTLVAALSAGVKPTCK